MSKRTVAYIKPQEPSFLTKLKQQAGYKEGPTVDTKRESLPQLNDEDFEDKDEDQPTVVVLKPGDLTAEQANEIKKQLDEESGPARLNERIVFRKPSKNKNLDEGVNSSESKKRSSSSTATDLSSGELKKSKKSKQKSSSVSSSKLLSFDGEDEEEN
ncbi:uncharacterized protein KIAA1143 homolog [Lycorma delicatula]|uniref:uncharacterized protein KIAA1143 homolog n=1 Tax=Lycorma delicatula TaxID=130591 RepID=UPI003F5197C4